MPYPVSHFPDALAHVKAKEGGYSFDQSDSGGETNHGITVAVARAHGYQGPMRAMQPSDAAAIYKKAYWDALRLDDVAALDYPLALKLFDAGVNTGTAQAGEWVQRTLNVMNDGGTHWADLTVDGQVGAKTVSAIRALHARRGSDGMAVLRRGVNCLQGSFYIALAERRPKDEWFAYGWLKQRVT